MAVKEMKRYLKSHRDEGVLLGESSFTIAGAEATQKVARFGLETPEKGLLRLSQLVVGAGCSRLEFLIERSSVTLRVHELRGLSDQVESLGKEVAYDANNPTMVLLACLHAGFERGTVRLGESLWRFSLASGFQRSHDPAPLGTDILEVCLERSAPSGFWARLRQALKRRALEYKVLRDRLGCCPVSVSVDGLSPYQDPRPGRPLMLQLFLLSTPAQAAMAVASPLGFQPLGPSGMEPAPSYETARNVANLRFFGGVAPKRQVIRKDSVLLAHIWIPTDVRQRGEIRLVAEGVTVGSFQPEFRLPIHGVVSAAGLDRDLSCLEVVHNEKLRSLGAYLAQEMHKRLMRLRHGSHPKEVESALRHGGYLPIEEARDSSKNKGRRSRMPYESEAKGFSSNESFQRAREEFNVQRRQMRGKPRSR